MATSSTSHKSLEIVQDLALIGKFQRSVAELRQILGAADFQILAPGMNLNTYATSGTVQDGVVSECNAITASTYSDVVTAKTLTWKKWKAQTSLEKIAARGFVNAVDHTDDSLLKDVQKLLMASVMSGISTGASGSAAGTGLQATLADAWAELGKVCENEAATPVFFANYDTVAAYLASANVTVQQAFGMNYIVNFMGLGKLIINSNVPDNKIWATAEENLVIACCNVDSIAEFQMQRDESGIFAVAHKKNLDYACEDTIVYSGLCVFPVYADRFIVGTIS